MTRKGSSAVGEVWRTLVLAGVVTAAMVAIGYVPTKRVGGSEAVPAMLAGCAISLFGSLTGAVPIAVAWRGGGRNVLKTVLLAMVLRFLVVLVLALSAALSGWFDRAPLLVWVAISYVLLLSVDTAYAVRFSGSVQTPDGP